MNIKQVKESIEEGQSLKFLAQAYSEIASLRLNRIRDGVERNRVFFKEITEVYQQLQKVATAKGVTLPKTTKKTVSVLITSNYRFYGNINNELIRYFIVQTAKYPGDKVVIGKTGLDFLKTMNYFHQIKPVTLISDLPNAAELKMLAEYVQKYEKVLVYYSEFKSVLVQKPVSQDITNKQSVSVGNSNANTITTNFIFEPDINKMLEFFDNQIKQLLLDQTFLESELARTASRLISMDSAQNNATEFIKKEQLLLAQGRRSISNIRMLETITSLVSMKEGSKK